MRTYIVCIDGTWNMPGQVDRDPIEKIEVDSETNVMHIFRFLTGNAGVTCSGGTNGERFPLRGSSCSDLGEVFYLNGVGSTGSWPKRQWQGAVGTGISDRIMKAYQFLASTYESGDRIFLFGFSRGAYAVRSLAGFLDHVGLPETPTSMTESELEQAYEIYRKKSAKYPGVEMGVKANVDFVGIWDTVGALGFGLKELSEWHDISPSNVSRVAHALALDETRETFLPEYWNGMNTNALIDEVWFSGAHSNIGGGYANKGLSNIGLSWMISKAVEAGLPTVNAYIDHWYLENSIAKARDSRQEFLRWTGPLQPLIVRKMRRKIPIHHKVHVTVFERLEMEEPYLPEAELDGYPTFPQTIGEFDPRRIAATHEYLEQKH